MAEMGSSTSGYSITEKLDKAAAFKTQGNIYFKEQNYKGALRQYHNGLMYLKGVECDIQNSVVPFMDKKKISSQEMEIMDKLSADLQNNLAACFLKETPIRSDRVIDCCLKVIEKQPSNKKALFRMGQAYFHLEDYSNSQEVLKEANDIAKGKDAAVRNLLDKIESKLKLEEKEYLKMYDNSLLKNSFK